MSQLSHRCFLLCQKTSHEPIELPDGQPVIIGRSPMTGITDTQLSRTQLELTADCTARTVAVRHIGSSMPSSVNCRPLGAGEVVQLADNDSLFLLENKFGHDIKFTDIGAVKRHSSDDNGIASPVEKKLKAVHPAVESNDESDALHEAEVSARLETLKGNAEGSSAAPIPSSSTGAGSASGSRTNSAAAGSVGKPQSTSSWSSSDTLHVYSSKDLRSSSKIAGFDLDGTIITTKSGKRFAEDCTDWKMLSDAIPGRLQQLVNDDYKIVIFTNQMGVQKKKLKLTDLKKKIVSIVTTLGVPAQVLVATSTGIYRKPAPGMWQYLCEQGNEGRRINLKDSFYVGDAAGRPAGWTAGKKKDFSCSDRLFAINIGITFETPDEYFLRLKKAKFELPPFDPRDVRSDIDVMVPRSTKLPFSSQEVIVMVGAPASGKSFFVHNNILPHGYILISRDRLGTWQKCVARATEELARPSKPSVVIDNTNPDLGSRERYVTVAKASGVTCRCFVMTTTLDHAKHNELYREMTDSRHQHISEIVFNTYNLKYDKPDKKEGFSAIVMVNFVPTFDDDDDEDLYKMYLSDK